MNNNRKKIILLGLVLILFITTSIVYAEDSRIPNGIPAEEEMKPPNMVEKNLAEALVSLGDSLFWAMDKLGLSINAIVFSQDIEDRPLNILKFSFDDSTIWGVVGQALYTAFKGVALMLMVSILTWIGTRFMAKKKTSDNFIYKQMIRNYVLVMILLFAMPKILHILNSLILLGTRGFSSGDSGLDFVESLRANAVEKERFWDALLYCGSTGLTIWFAFIYSYRNIFMLFLFMYFPIFGLFLTGDKMKSVFDRWGKEMLSILSVPLLDAGLLWGVQKLIELGLEGFIAFLCTCFIIPVRGYFRSMFGFGGMRSEMMGFAALNGFTNLVGSGIKGARGGIKGIASGIGDKLEARRFGQSSANDESKNSDDGKSDFSQTNAYKLDTPDNALRTSTKGTDKSFDGLNMVRRRLDIPLKMPTNGKDVYSYNLNRQGNKKIMQTLGKMGGSILGAGMAGATTSLLGTAATTNAMSLGGEMGGAAGELTGALMSNMPKIEYMNHAGDAFGGKIFDKIWYPPRADLNKKRSKVDLSKNKNDIVLKNTTQLGNVDATATSNDSININIDDLERVQPENIEELDSPDGFSLNKGADAQSIHQDAVGAMDSELEVQIRNEANANAINLTGVDPRQLRKEWEGHVSNKSTELRQSYTDKGINITKQVEEEIRQQSEAYGHGKVDSFSKLGTFEQVRAMEYNRIAIEKSYDKLKDGGYSASALDDMSMIYKEEIADLIRRDLQNHINSDDIDINII